MAIIRSALALMTILACLSPSHSELEVSSQIRQQICSEAQQSAQPIAVLCRLVDCRLRLDTGSCTETEAGFWHRPQRRHRLITLPPPRATMLPPQAIMPPPRETMPPPRPPSRLPPSAAHFQSPPLYPLRPPPPSLPPRPQCLCLPCCFSRPRPPPPRPRPRLLHHKPRCPANRRRRWA